MEGREEWCGVGVVSEGRWVAKARRRSERGGGGEGGRQDGRSIEKGTLSRERE